jgi:hypothetical protein
MNDGRLELEIVEKCEEVARRGDQAKRAHTEHDTADEGGGKAL